ncbi:MAG: glycosyltransferase family 4 protein [Thermoleophilia bacterium]
MLHIGINGRSLFRQLTGVQHYAFEVTSELCSMESDNVRVSVFAGREGRDPGSLPLPVNSGFIPANGPVRGLLWEQTLLRRMARKAAVDVLFSPANVAPLSPPAPGVVTIHDLAFLLYPEFFSRSFALYYRNIIPRIVRESTAIITDSENTRADLVNLVGAEAEKIVTIPLGASRAFRQRLSKARLAEVRERYGLPERFFLSLASLDPRKNLKRLVQAYRLLPEDLVDEVGLVIVGGGNRVFADTGIAAELSRVKRGRVVSPGYVPSEDLPALYRSSTALVFPSLYEGFGLPVIEAMAASTPVITSNRSSLPEVAGNAAVMIDPESVEEIAAAMELMATDSGTRNLLIERGKKRAAGFTWNRTARSVMKTLQAVAEDRFPD